MKKRLGIRLITFLLWAAPFVVSAQLESFENLEEVTQEGFFKTHFTNTFKGFTDFGDPFAMSGGIGLNMRSYSAYNGDARQDPFFYSLNANVNVRIYKLNLPFSLLVTAKNKEAAYPNPSELIQAFKDNVADKIENQKNRFVRFGVSPQYKWMKLHLGHRSMDFSQFTLANLNFFGAGMELTPDKLRFSAMYGRLAKAEPLDISLQTPNVPIYERIGWGAKLGYGDENQSADLIVFTAKDRKNSISIPDESSEQVSPEENLVLGLNAQKLFFEKFRFKGEFAMSAFSPNSLDAAGGDGMIPSFLYTNRTTTESTTALDVALNYEAEKYTAGVQLKRIDPNYNSLGAYFFNNDVVDLLANLNFGLLDGAINTTLSAGVQSNNLKLLNPATTKRIIYSADVSYSKDAFSAGANYSNNTTDVAYVLNEGLDSLNAVIVTQDGGLNLNYALPDQNQNQHIFTLTANIQEVGDDVTNPLESASSQMLVGNFIYNFALAESKWKFSAKTNFNQNELAQMITRRYGGGLGIAKSLFEDKMNFGLDFNYFLNTNEIAPNSTNLNAQFLWSYSLFEGLSANMNWGLLRTSADDVDPFAELTGTLGIQYTFNVTPSPEKKAARKAKKSGEEIPTEEPQEEPGNPDIE